eukprot:gene5319-biopygen7036
MSPRQDNASTGPADPAALVLDPLGDAELLSREVGVPPPGQLRLLGALLLQQRVDGDSAGEGRGGGGSSHLLHAVGGGEVRRVQQLVRLRGAQQRCVAHLAIQTPQLS